jgi:predicted nucleic acid-binding protein
MSAVFIDTSHLTATFHPDDDLHEAALATVERLEMEGATLLTTEVVLIEFLTAVSRMGIAGRKRAVAYVRELRSYPRLRVVPQTFDLFDRGLALYESRADKRYSMVDCISMVVCKDEKINDVLTYDKDFAQEGFQALLRGQRS